MFATRLQAAAVLVLVALSGGSYGAPDTSDDTTQLKKPVEKILQARELRLAMRFSEARKVLDEILATKAGKTFKVRKEIALTWMDEKKYGAAAKQWSEIISSFGPNPLAKRNYSESCYQYTYCLYMYAKNIDPNDPKLGPKKAEYIKRAARLIARFENDWLDESKKRYEVLLKNEESLRKEYDALLKEKAQEE
jgi:hypothetical protein